jgi:hypothetical protein
MEMFFVLDQVYKDLLTAAGKAAKAGNLPRAESLTKAAQALQKGIISRLEAMRDSGGLNALFEAAWMNPYVAIEGVTPDVLLPDLERARSNLESIGAPRTAAGQAPIAPTTRADRRGTWGRPKRDDDADKSLFERWMKAARANPPQCAHGLLQYWGFTMRDRWDRSPSGALR